MEHDIVFLFDVDNTLLDNDRIQAELTAYLDEVFGPRSSDLYWNFFETRRRELGYADYLGALEQYRLEKIHDQRVPRISSWLIDYPFAECLYECALSAITHVQKWGPAVILSDGDGVFQPWKIERSGLWSAVEGQVLIYVHKEQELEEVERLYPAKHYVMVDDKLRILGEIKRIWKDRVTTVFARQGHYARDLDVLANCPPADIRLDHLGDLINYTLPAFAAPGRESGISDP